MAHQAVIAVKVFDKMWVADLNEDEFALLNLPSVWWGPHTRTLPLLTLLDTVLDAEGLAWKVLGELEKFEGYPVPLNPEVDELLLVSVDDEVSYQRGVFRWKKIHQVLALAGLLRHSRLEEYQRAGLAS